jgi:hypothetical protein
MSICYLVSTLIGRCTLGNALSARKSYHAPSRQRTEKLYTRYLANFHSMRTDSYYHPTISVGVHYSAGPGNLTNCAAYQARKKQFTRRTLIVGCGKNLYTVTTSLQGSLPLSLQATSKS